MADLGTAYINIVPKAPGIDGKIGSLLGDSGMEEAGDKAGSGFLSGLGKGILGGVAAVGTSVAAIGTTIVSETSRLAEAGDNIDKMSQKLGISRQAYQEWDAILQHSGASIDSLQPSMKTLAVAAETGSKAFDALGISQEQIAGMNQEELFSATITALQGMDDETQRTYLASQLLGRGATELGALLNTSAEDTEAMRQRVHELGGVMSDDAVMAAAGFQDSLQDMQTAFAGIRNGIVADFLPGITDVMSGFTALIAGEEGAEDQIAAGFDSILTNAGTAIDTFFSLADTLIPKVGDIIIEHLPEMIAMGVELIVKLAVGFVQAIPKIIEKVPEIFRGIGDALRGIDWLSLGREIVNGIINGIISMGSALWESVSNLARNAWQGAKNALGIASPSKVFANEVGRWIPAGIAEGIDDNLAPMDQSVENMAMAAVSDLDRAARSGSAAEGTGGAVDGNTMAQLIQAIRDQKYEFYMDGKQITECVTIRQRRAARSGGVA